MFITVKEEIELPFEINQSYKTKFATGESFLITKIRTIAKSQIIVGFIGIYSSCPHLGECPINIDRLIPHKQFTGKELDIEVCGKCHKECSCKIEQYEKKF